jgi:hypothetical protein
MLIVGARVYESLSVVVRFRSEDILDIEIYMF